MIPPSGRVPEWGLDWFSVAIEACGSGTSDLGSPRGFLEYLMIYRVKRQCERPPRWAQPTRAHPSGHPPSAALPIGGLLVHKKSTNSFVVFGHRLILISCDVKNKQKTTTGTRHRVNRLVPKNGIKLL